MPGSAGCARHNDDARLWKKSIRIAVRRRWIPSWEIIMYKASIAALVFLVSAAAGVFSPKAEAFSVSLSCGTGLCSVSVDTSGVATPVHINWDISGSVNIVVPRNCSDRQFCSFYCPAADDDPTHPVAFPVTVGVVISDANGQVVGTATALAHCAGQVA
jgi:hypothetical protein